jgi:hypothetical protein
MNGQRNRGMYLRVGERLVEPILSGGRGDATRDAMSPRRSYQQEPVLRHLPTLYPPDGKVPDRIPTETVRQQVAAELAHENQELICSGAPAMPARSWETVHRALGRDKQRRTRARPAVDPGPVRLTLVGPLLDCRRSAPSQGGADDRASGTHATNTMISLTMAVLGLATVLIVLRRLI